VFINGSVVEPMESFPFFFIEDGDAFLFEGMYKGTFSSIVLKNNFYFLIQFYLLILFYI